MVAIIVMYDGCHRASLDKRAEFKFMKEIKPGYYLIMPEIVAEMNAKPKTQNPRP